MSNVPLSVDEEKQDEILQTPMRPVSFLFLLLMCIASFTMWMGLVPLTQIVIPTDVSIIYANFPHDVAIRATAVLQSFGGLSALIIYPLVGALSDRTRTRFGRRRPWIVGGALGAAVMLVLMSTATTYLLLAIFWIGFCLCATTTQSVIFTLLPDKFPVHQRGKAAAFLGLMTPLGIVAGSILAGKSGVTTTFLVIAVLEVVCVLLFATQLREELPTGEVPPFNFMRFLAGFWLNPRTYPDFALAWFARLFLVFGCVILQDYLIFFLPATHLFTEKGASLGVAIFQSFSTIGIFIGSFGTGFISDRLQRRKPFAIFAGAMVSCALLVVAFFPTLVMIYVSAVLFGIGFGTYSATEIAMGSQLLRSKESHGKDMGLLALAGNIPQTFGPYIAAGIITLTHNYTLLFVSAAISPLFSMACIPFIKRVK